MLESKDFESLMLPNIFDLDDKESAYEKYPLLQKYQEFNVKIKDYNKVIKYISFVYDINSPLNTELKSRSPHCHSIHPLQHYRSTYSCPMRQSHCPQ